MSRGARMRGTESWSWMYWLGLACCMAAQLYLCPGPQARCDELLPTLWALVQGTWGRLLGMRSTWRTPRRC